MEAKFKSLSIFAFQSQFSSAEDCYDYLVNLKWGGGYQCCKCGHSHYCAGKKIHDRQCTRCNHLESPTSGTLFHKVKFPIQKAFWIVYFMATNKKGIASTELSRKLQLRQKTCWLFRMKVMQAMASSEQHPLEGVVEVDEFVLGQQKKGSTRRKKDKTLVIIGIEKKGKGVSRIYAHPIRHSDKRSIQGFIRRNVKDQANIKTNAWSANRALSREMKNIHPKKSNKKMATFTLKDRVITSLTAWLRGTHGHASHLVYYLDEYCFRFNRHLMKEGLFENLIQRMVRHKPAPYKLIIAYAPNSF